MNKYKILLLFLLVASILFSAGCSSIIFSEDTEATENTVEKSTSQTMYDTAAENNTATANEQQLFSEATGFGCEVKEITESMPHTDRYDIQILSAYGDKILYAAQLTSANEEGEIKPQSIHIYDVNTCSQIADWAVTDDMYCISGVLIDDSTAVCSYSYINAENDTIYQVIQLGSEEKVVAEFHGELLAMEKFNRDDVLLSYEQDDGSFGIGCIRNAEYIPLFEKGSDNGYISLGGPLSALAYGENGFSGNMDHTFCTFLAKEGYGTLLLFQDDEVIEEYSLKYEDEKLDSFCLTHTGILACISIGEENEDAHREMVLLADGERQILNQNDWLSGARYQITGYYTTLYVDSNWGLYTCNIREGSYTEQSLDSLLPEELRGQPIQLLQADDFTFLLIYPMQNRVFQMIVAPAA